MKKKLTHKLLLLAVVMQSAALLADARVLPFIQWRSEGRDTARKLVGTTSHHVYLHDMESFYGTFNMTPQYDQTFRANELTQCLFGDSLIGNINFTSTNNDNNNCSDNCGDIIAIQGSLVENKLARSWMAENFYLPRDFQSTISFSPKVQNFLVDFYLYVGLDEWVKGLYFRLYGPVVNNRVTLNACETLIEEGTLGYDPGFFSSEAVTTDNLLPSALSFFHGCTTIVVPGITAAPLARARISNDTLTTTGFAELRMELGWNYLHEDYHFGFNVQAAAPTGKRPHGDYIFETQVGNGKHWELGVGLSAHWTMWRSEDDEKHLDFVFEADITHLFNASQTRTFDLIGKPNSRYMLAEKVNKRPAVNLFGNTDPAAGALGTVTAALAQFNAEYSPVANFTTLPVDVSIGVQGDIVAMLNYTSRGFSWDLGYNYWGMSHEHIELRDSDCTPPFLMNTWALKGDAQTYGFVDGTGTPVALSGTESLANIHRGTNVLNAGTTPDTAANTNIGVNNAQFAQTAADDLGESTPINVSPAAGSAQVRTSIQPVFITVEDLNIQGAETRGSSNKFFTHFSYTWVDREDWIPYLGIGCEVEFGSHSDDDHDDNSTTPCNDNHGLNCALSKWAILVKGGVSFD